MCERRESVGGIVRSCSPFTQGEKYCTFCCAYVQVRRMGIWGREMT